MGIPPWPWKRRFDVGMNGHPHGNGHFRSQDHDFTRLFYHGFMFYRHETEQRITREKQRLLDVALWICDMRYIHGTPEHFLTGELCWKGRQIVSPRLS